MPLTPVLPCHGPPNGSDVPPLRNRYIGWSVKVPGPWSVLVGTGAPLLTVRRAMSLVMSPSVMTTALCGELKLVLSVVATTATVPLTFKAYLKVLTGAARYMVPLVVLAAVLSSQTIPVAASLSFVTPSTTVSAEPPIVPNGITGVLAQSSMPSVHE